MLIKFPTALILIIAIDYIWLGLLMSQFYMRQMGNLGRIVDGKFQILMFPAVMAYVLLALGISYFVIRDFNEPWISTFTRGAFLGLVIYGTYDMTNMASLTRWPWPLALVDMAWGSLLCGTTAVATRGIAARFLS